MAGRPKHYNLDSAVFAYQHLSEDKPILEQPAHRPDYGATAQLPVFRIVLVGENRVGKTALVTQFVNDGYILSVIPTTETEVYYHRLEGNEEMEENPQLRDIMLEIRDVGGHWLLTDDEPNAKQFIKDADGIMFCVSMRDSTSLQRMKEGHFKRQVMSLVSENPAERPVFLMVGCQKDKQGGEGGADRKEVKNVAKDLNMDYVTTSAAGCSTRHAFYMMADMIFQKKMDQGVVLSTSPERGCNCFCC